MHKMRTSGNRHPVKYIFARIASFFALLILMFPALRAQIPENYYDSAYYKSGYELKAALSNIIFDHTALWYGSDAPGGLWHAFRTTDVRPNGYVWDIYSNCNFIPWEDGHVASSGECNGGTQQEHTFCQSWMNYCETPLYSDMFHMYPVDAWVNGRRNNNPFGEVPDEADWTTRWFANGARLGYNAFVGSDMTSTCGIAYEPADEYKGDIARGFLYIATCYMFADSAFSEDYEMTIRSQLRPWALDLMLKWHRQDPVSAKEINRNNLIYSQFQHNRNPFIDYPELANLIFGPDSSNALFSPTLVRAPRNFTITPASNGARRATLTWTNPTTRIDGQPAVLNTIVIQRNGVTIHTIANPIPGDSLSWTDNHVPNNRTYEYRIFSVSSDGNGLMANGKAYIGQYCPLTAELYDEYYDGWQGDARIEFQDTLGNVLAFSKLPCGEGWENLYDIQLPPETINCVWIPGDYDEENSFRLYDYELELIFDATGTGVEDFNGIFYTFTNDRCPLATIPDTTFADSIVCVNQLPLIWNGVTFTESGIDTVTLSSAYGFDSVVIMRVAVETSALTESRYIIENELPYLWNGHTFVGPDTFTYIEVTPSGCTREVTLHLYVYFNSYSTQTRNICENELPYEWDGLLFENAGTQEVTFTDIHGADSVISYCLVVDTCNSISPWQSNPHFRLGPNPTSGHVTIFINKDEIFARPAFISILDARGRKILRKRLNDNQIDINLTQQPDGFYFIRIESGKSVIATGTVIKRSH